MPWPALATTSDRQGRFRRCCCPAASCLPWAGPPDLLELVKRFTNPSSRGRALDVGCADGVFGHTLLSVGFDEVWGVEPDPTCAGRAASRLTGVVAAPFHAVAEHAPFDLIVFGDSLEHLQYLGGVSAPLGPSWGATACSSSRCQTWRIIACSFHCSGADGSMERPASSTELISDSSRRSRSIRAAGAAGLVPECVRTLCIPPRTSWKRAVVCVVHVVAPHLVTSKVNLVCRRSHG